MRKYRTDSIEHVWAHNTDPRKCKRQGNMSFEGPAAYSWATIVAYKYPNKKGDGGTVVMAGEGIQKSGYTSWHMEAYRCALDSNWRVIYADLPAATYGYSRAPELASIEGLRDCHDIMKKKLQKKVSAVKHAKSYSSRAAKWREVKSYLDYLNDLTLFLNRKPVTLDDLDIDAAAEDASEKRWDDAVAARPLTPRMRRYCSEYLVSETPENIEKWRNREYNGGKGWTNIYLRMSKDGDRVETSRGVSVPIRACRMMFLLCRKMKQAGTCYIPEDNADFMVGIYRLDQITADGNCVVGCHHLDYTEMEKLYNENPEET